MANIDIKYGFIIYINATTAISKFDNKKVIFFKLVTGGQSDRGTKWPEDKVSGAKVTEGTKWLRGQSDRGTKWPGTKWPGDKVTRGQSKRGQSDRGQSDRGQSDRGQSDQGTKWPGQSDRGQSERGQSVRTPLQTLHPGPCFLQIRGEGVSWSLQDSLKLFLNVN
jgi:hypothetical protein